MTMWKKLTLIAVIAASFGFGASNDLNAASDKNPSLNISNPNEQVAWRYYYWGGGPRWNYWGGPRWGYYNNYYWRPYHHYRWW